MNSQQVLALAVFAGVILIACLLMARLGGARTRKHDAAPAPFFAWWLGSGASDYGRESGGGDGGEGGGGGGDGGGD